MFLVTAGCVALADVLTGMIFCIQISVDVIPAVLNKTLDLISWKLRFRTKIFPLFALPLLIVFVLPVLIFSKDTLVLLVNIIEKR